MDLRHALYLVLTHLLGLFICGLITGILVTDNIQCLINSIWCSARPTVYQREDMKHMKKKNMQASCKNEQKVGLYQAKNVQLDGFA